MQAFNEDNLLSPLKNTLLRLQKLLLQEKLDTIRNLDQEILAVFTDTQLDEGVCEVDEFTSFTQLAIMRIDAASTESQQTPSTKLGIVETLPGTKLETETHPTPSSSPGIVVTSFEIHLTLSAPETHLSISISPEVVFAVSGGVARVACEHLILGGIQPVRFRQNIPGIMTNENLSGNFVI